MNRVIIINAISARYGGQKTVLDHFFSYAQMDSRVNYVFFVNEDVELPCVKNYKNIRVIKVSNRNFISRLKWDLFGLNKWVKKHLNKIDYAISLQNTGFYLKNVKKGVLIHNMLPFISKNWSFFKKDERRFWFLRNFYRIYQKIFISKRFDIFVQTDLMLETIKNEFKKNDIYILKHDFGNVCILKYELKPKLKPVSYFYPADDYKYKNHKMIVDAVVFLIKKNIQPNINIIFTLDKNSWVYDYVCKHNVQDYFDFRGRLDHSLVLREYKNSILIFPSEIESLGLPLIEAKKQNAKIIAFAHPFNIELLEDYENKRILPYSKNNYSYNVKQIVKEFSCSNKQYIKFSEFIRDKYFNNE
jgi:hypothetical protein